MALRRALIPPAPNPQALRAARERTGELAAALPAVGAATIRVVDDVYEGVQTRLDVQIRGGGPPSILRGSWQAHLLAALLRDELAGTGCRRSRLPM